TFAIKIRFYEFKNLFQTFYCQYFNGFYCWQKSCTKRNFKSKPRFKNHPITETKEGFGKGKQTFGRLYNTIILRRVGQSQPNFKKIQRKLYKLARVNRIRNAKLQSLGGKFFNKNRSRESAYGNSKKFFGCIYFKARTKKIRF